MKESLRLSNVEPWQPGKPWMRLCYDAEDDGTYFERAVIAETGAEIMQVGFVVGEVRAEVVNTLDGDKLGIKIVREYATDGSLMKVTPLTAEQKRVTAKRRGRGLGLEPTGGSPSHISNPAFGVYRRDGVYEQ